MYPLIQLGPLNLSSGGVFILLALLLWNWLLSRLATRNATDLSDQVDRLFLAMLAGAIVGGRLWYGIFNWDLYGANLVLFLALRIGDLAWPGALLGGLLAGYLWSLRRGVDFAPLADIVALTLPLPQALASIGMLLSGEAFGAPTNLPWGVPLFGALRHPTQIYVALAALLTLVVLTLLQHRATTTGRSLPPGTLLATYLGLNGLAMLLIEALRADSLLTVGGVRVAQATGLAMMIGTLLWARQNTSPAATPEHSSA